MKLNCQSKTRVDRKSFRIPHVWFPHLDFWQNLNSSRFYFLTVCWSHCFAVSSSHACFTCKLIPATWAQKATKGELLFNSVRINFRISFLVGLLCFSWGEKIWLAREGGRLTLLKLYFKTKGGRFSSSGDWTNRWKIKDLTHIGIPKGDKNI